MARVERSSVGEMCWYISIQESSCGACTGQRDRSAEMGSEVWKRKEEEEEEEEDKQKEWMRSTKQVVQKTQMMDDGRDRKGDGDGRGNVGRVKGPGRRGGRNLKRLCPCVLIRQARP